MIFLFGTVVIAEELRKIETGQKANLQKLFSLVTESL
jgi:hypothetical protein